MGTLLLVVAATLTTGAAGAELSGRTRGTTLLFGGGVAGLWLAMSTLVWALVRQDTSLRIVVDHTRPGLGLLYRVMGLWGGSAGSLLTFTAVVGAVLLAAPTQPGRRWLGPIAIAILAWTSVALASPFERLENPARAGSGLTPILEHWAMVIHPPLLYLGLALALVPAVATAGRSPAWGRAALVVLTGALALGGGWAYVELGWGGWWAWDPVENAALIPWLLLVVGVHVPTRFPIAAWSRALVWPAVFAGTAMTRTSLRTSVHAFADADSLGWVLWPLAALVSITVLWWTAHSTTDSGRPSPSRLVPAVLASLAALVVAIGTFRPFVPGDGTEGVFYSRFLYPVAIIAVVGVGLLPRRHHRRSRLRLDGGLGLVLGLVLALLVGWTLWYQLVFAGALGVGSAALVGGGVRPAGRFCSHLGLLLVLAGALGGTASLTRTIPLELGESAAVGGHVLVNQGVDLIDGVPPVIIATVVLDDSHVLAPSLSVFPERKLRLPEVATHSRPWEDVQVILRSADDDGSILLTVNVEPLTALVWMGAVVLIVGLAEDQRGRRSRRARTNASTVETDPAGASDPASAGSASPSDP